VDPHFLAFLIVDGALAGAVAMATASVERV
jgi:hypothetical protein